MRRKKHRTGNRQLSVVQPDPAVEGVAFIWYRREEYARVRELSVDADKFHETYEQWEQNALELVRNLEGRGVQVIRVPMVLDECLAWCAEQNRPFNSSARSEYAMKWASERATGGAD